MESHLYLLDKFPRALFDGIRAHSLTLCHLSFSVYVYASALMREAWPGRGGAWLEGLLRS